MPLDFFDANACIGRGATPPCRNLPRERVTADVLLEDMDRFGIADALVHHRLADTAPDAGNERLLAERAGHGRLHPCWTLSPYAYHRNPDPAALAAQLRRHGVRAVRLVSPARGLDAYPCESWMVGPVVEAVEAMGLPLFCRLRASEAHTLCRDFPRLTVVLTIGYDAWVRLMELHPNLLIDTSHAWRHEMIEEIGERFGAHRVVFGSGYGQGDQLSPGVALTAVAAAGIQPADKQAVAGGTLRRLLGLPARNAPPAPGADDPFLGPLRRGEPVRGELIIDVHAHPASEPARSPRMEPAGMVAVMDRLGVARACLAGSGSPDMAFDGTVRAVTQFPDRFVPYTTVDPHYPDEILPILEGRRERLGVTHIKLHPEANHFPLTGKNYEPAFEFARRTGAVILSHSQAGKPDSDPALFAEMAERYPDVRLVMGHAGNNSRKWREAAEILKAHPNLYVDTSGFCLTGTDVLEAFVEVAGPERILLGTDFQFLAAAGQLGAVVHARLTLRAKRLILGWNAARLFRIPVDTAVYGTAPAAEPTGSRSAG